MSIIGLSKQPREQKQIIEVSSDGNLLSRETKNINAYLVAAPNVFVFPRSQVPDERSSMQFGNHPYYANELMLRYDEARELLARQPKATAFIRPLYGSQEFIASTPRACLWINSANVQQVKQMKEIWERVEAVRKTRQSKTTDIQAQKLVDAPFRFRDQYEASSDLLIVPIVSSENREYLPVGLESSRAVVHNKAFALYDAPLWNMALIASRLHWVWIGTVCVRLRTDFSYSNTLGWNTFPVPMLTEKNKSDLTRCAEDILLAREAHFPATIADLYNPDAMPEDLRRAHERNDETLERIYIGRKFKNDTERLEKLFAMYTEMTAAQTPVKKVTAKKVKTQ